MARKIPGWKQVSDEDVQKALVAGELSYQLVDEMEIGHRVLQKLVDEWLDQVMTVWMWTSHDRNGARRGNHTRTEATLREWGKIDENGLPIQEDQDDTQAKDGDTEAAQK